MHGEHEPTLRPGLSATWLTRRLPVMVLAGIIGGLGGCRVSEDHRPLHTTEALVSIGLHPDYTFQLRGRQFVAEPRAIEALVTRDRELPAGVELRVEGESESGLVTLTLVAADDEPREAEVEALVDELEARLDELCTAGQRRLIDHLDQRIAELESAPEPDDETWRALRLDLLERRQAADATLEESRPEVDLLSIDSRWIQRRAGNRFTTSALFLLLGFFGAGVLFVAFDRRP